MTISETVLENSKSALLATRGQEAWKYTNLSALAVGAWEEAEHFAPDELPARSVFPVYPGAKSGEIVLLNGRLVSEWSTLQLPGLKIRLSKEPHALTDSALVKAPVQADLSAILMNEVLLVEVAPGTVLKEPLVISNFVFGKESLSKWSVAASRVSVHVGERSEIALVEITGGEGRTIQLPVTTISIAKSARVSHARFNLSQQSAAQLGFAKLTLARDSFVETTQFTLGGRLCREDLSIRLTEPGSEAVLDGLYLADRKRHVDHSTAVEHLAPQTTSSQLYKGVLNDEARAVFNGRVHIHRLAQGSNAAQLNNNLLLSQKAEIDTKPELEIDADDVKASHGATIGRIDEDHIFYLQTRGVPEAQAIKILSAGFAQDVAFRIRNESLRLGAEAIVAQALAKTEAAHG